MAQPNRDTRLRLIEDFEATAAEFQSKNVVLATPGQTKCPITFQQQ